ncbi:hypothetical protein [Ferirhizobium litorale]|uniref:hypothetical protein n=1 Tax=Ferirhizobium litorale TaxID=2927786 RepID=UPI002893450F|nr:hypothetical protein [Fererhizobium litorale]
MCIASFMFFAIYFDYITWAMVQLSGCAQVAGSCGRIGARMSGEFKPLGFWATGAVMFACTVMRIRYLRLHVGWALAAAVWFLVSAPFLMLFDDMWSGQLTFGAVFSTVPIAFLYLVAFAIYLSFPLEEHTERGGEDEEEGPMARLPERLRLATGLAALHSVLLSLAIAPEFPKVVTQLSESVGLGEMLSNAQPTAAYLLNFGTGGMAPAYAILAIFIAGLGAGVVTRTNALSVPA